MSNGFEYHVNFYDAGRRSLGRHPIELDAEPARQLLAFDAMRRSGRMPEDAAVADVMPCWNDEQGAPVVCGITARCNDDAITLGSECFAQPVKDKLRELVNAKQLDAESVAHYQILAFHKEEPPHAAGGIESDLEDTAPPLRAAGISASLGASTLHDAEHAHDADPPVLIPRRVITQMERLTLDAGELETGGVLIGHLVRDAEARQIALQVTALIPARETRATSANLTFTPETWSAVESAIALRKAGEIVLGWAHSHPVFAWEDLCANCGPEKRAVCALRRPFLSQDDLVLHRAVFYRAFMVALLCSRDVELENALFGWRRGSVARRAFHVIDSAN